MRQGIVIAVFSLMAAVAVAGWSRKPAPAASPAVWDQAVTPANYLDAPQQPVSAPVQRATSQPVRARRAVARSTESAPVRQTTVRKSRSFAHSAAIVAGSAGAGAAIGALAGGGKGAAIGALSGGGAGFLYDRLTRNR
jgi:hypothetical protein